MVKGNSKGQIVGFLALGAVIFLVAVAFYSARTGNTTTSPSISFDASLPVEGAPPPPKLTESIPDIRAGRNISATINDVSLSPQASLLAERFRCVCGCNDILAECTCSETPGSRDMKQYLQELVDGGKTPAEVEGAMVARYGAAALP